MCKYSTATTVALLSLAAFLTGAYGLFRLSLPRSIQPSDLLTCCAAINFQGDLVGTGFFVQTFQNQTNTYFITTQHSIALIRKSTGRDTFDLSVIVKKRNALGGVALTIPWSDSTFRPNGTLFDLAVIRIGDGLLQRPDIRVTPIFFDYKAAKTRNNTPAPLEAGADSLTCSSTEQIRCAIEATKTEAPKPQLPPVSAGRPGFLLASSRVAFNVSVGNDISTLVTQNYLHDSSVRDPFHIFLRKGSLSYYEEDQESLHARGPMYRFLIDCQVAKGNSGAPVFLTVRNAYFDGSVRETPHVLGILTGAVKAKGAQQNIEFTMQDSANEKSYTIKGEPIFDENSGLSVVIPIDYLALLLIEHEQL